jgi:hypothetical protein
MTTATANTLRRRPRRAVLGGVAVAATMVLVAAGCGDDDDTTSAGSGSGSRSGDEMTVSLTTPADGADVGSPFDVEVDPSVDIGEPDTGLHHVHLYYDGNTQDGEYDLVYQPTFTVDRDLDPGEHTIEAVVANADHSLTDARDEVTVTVGAAGGSDMTDTTETDATEPDAGTDTSPY